eukprot:TRINITY_DN14747_c0_g2_i1.p1 TRINITY_DN14747_c0_g2~~TRINITY_DN14747_c0_g2_i1.p1  ORF type:complete len:488 (-),score=74.63 TRINITY_DN14747_c0_g2_i1:871-2334(-)
MASFFGSQSQRTVPGGAMSSSLPFEYVAGPGPVSPTAAMKGPSAVMYMGTPAGVTPQYTAAKNDACCNIRNLLFGLLSILCLGLVAAALFLVILPSQNSGLEELEGNATHLQLPSSSDSAAFDCFLGFWDWQNRWSDEQQAFCCKKQKRACKPTRVDYDCYSGSVGMWTNERRTKCCETARIGCLPSATNREGHAYDCTAGYSNWENGWSAAKKAWCCKREGAGCSLPYDCRAGYSNWEKGWSEDKKQWCCHNQQKGCIQNALYDCSAGYANWKTGWSADKKSWCCQHESHGCTEPYDCHAGFSNWQKGWSAGKKDFCCRKHQLGCVVAEPIDLYDCRADFEQWKAEWPKDKISWCCHNKNIACAGNQSKEKCEKASTTPVPASNAQAKAVEPASTTVAIGVDVSTTAASESIFTSLGVSATAESQVVTTSAVVGIVTTVATTAALEETTAKVATTAINVAPATAGAVIVMGGPTTTSTNPPEEGSE